MEKPPIITVEDKWFAYIAELLEEIRDAVKPVSLPIAELKETDPKLEKPKWGRKHGKDV